MNIIADFNARMNILQMMYGTGHIKVPNIIYHPDEIFTESPLFPGYLIGNYGTVYNIAEKAVVRPNSHKTKKTIYLYLWIRNAEGKSVLEQAHRLVMIAFAYRPDYKSLQVNHKNKCTWFNYYNPYDPENSNLEWSTGLENVQHELTHGITEGHPFENYDIYTDEQIREVCRLMSQGVTNYKIISDASGIKYEKIHAVIKNLKKGNYRANISREFDMPTTSPQIHHTEAEVRRICELASEGYTIDQTYDIMTREGYITKKSFIIAIRCRSEHCSFWRPIYSQYEFKNIIHYKLDDEIIERICQLAKAGYNSTMIAKELGLYDKGFSVKQVKELVRKLKRNKRMKSRHISTKYFPLQ